MNAVPREHQPAIERRIQRAYDRMLAANRNRYMERVWREDPKCRIRFMGNVIGIRLANGWTAVADADDYDKLSKWCWHAVGAGRRRYAMTNQWVNGKKVSYSMHRVIMGLEHGDPIVVDHINGVTLDNTKINLRRATASQNAKNVSNVRSRHGFKGVTKSRGRFVAVIMSDRVVVPLGSFATAEDAAAAYDKAALELHGEFAKTNKMLGLL